MQVADVAGLYAESGPFATVYLDLTGRVENAARHLELRWRGLRGRLAAAGTDPDTLQALDAEVGSARPGDAALVAFAAGGKVRFRLRVEDAAIADAAHAGPLPHAGPLLAWAQTRLRHVVVAVDRTGADIAAYDDGREPVLVQEITGSNDEIQRSAPGGWSQLRFQHRAEDSWEHNAAEAAAVVDRVVADVGAELVLVTGDVRAEGFLLEHLSERTRPLARRLDTGGGRHVDGAAAVRSREVAEQVQAEVRARAAALLQRYAEERGQGDRAAEGAAATAAALSRAQVGTLLVAATGLAERTGWFGPDPTAVALDRDTLAGLGVPATEAPLADVLLRAAAGTGAALHLLAPEDAAALPDGVGALLRYA